MAAALVACTLVMTPARADDDAPLAAALAEMQAQSAERLPEAMRMLFERGIVDVGASGVLDRALGEGDAAPGFTLPGATGTPTALADLLDEGPVVLTFYRGGWCPYCNVQLRALQAMLPDFAEAGATLVAISPDLPDHSLDTAQKENLAFPVLSDADNEVARAYGVVYALPEYLVEAFAPRLDLPARTGSEAWKLPLAATYVIDGAGVIQYAFVHHDYRKRAEPAEVLAAVRKLAP